MNECPTRVRTVRAPAACSSSGTAREVIRLWITVGVRPAASSRATSRRPTSTVTADGLTGAPRSSITKHLSAVTVLVGLREVARELAAGRTPTVIHNLITSRAVPELLQAAGARTVRTRVGHSFIKAQMAENDAVFGGEHSAHYYFRDFFFADTGMLAALHVLAALAEAQRPDGSPMALSELADAYEPYVASGEINSRVADVAAATRE